MKKRYLPYFNYNNNLQILSNLVPKWAMKILERRGKVQKWILTKIVRKFDNLMPLFVKFLDWEGNI